MALQVGSTTTAHSKTSWQEDQHSAWQDGVSILGECQGCRDRTSPLFHI